MWNVTLICVTFSLALLGTFLVRSGILESIHAFGDSTVGGPLLGLIAVVMIGSTLLIVSRLDDLRSEKRIESLRLARGDLPRQQPAAGRARGRDLLGHVLPADLGALHRQKASLAAPWFDRYTTPLAILLVLFTGIGPLFAWRRVSLGAARRLLAWPGAGGRGGHGAADRCFTDAGSHPLALVMFALASFALAALVQEFATRRRRLPVAQPGGSYPRALAGLFARNRRRYGGYVVHAGVAVLLIAVAASSSFQTSRDLRLRPGPVGDAWTTTGSPTRSRPRRSARAEQRLDLRRGPQRDQGRQAPTRPSIPSRNYYAGVAADPRRAAGAGPTQLLRGRGDERGRAQDHGERRPMDRDASRPRPAEPAHQRGGPPARADRQGRLAEEHAGRSRRSARSRAWRSATSSSSYLKDPPPATSGST